MKDSNPVALSIWCSTIELLHLRGLSLDVDIGLGLSFMFGTSEKIFCD